MTRESSGRPACFGLGDLFYPNQGFGHADRVAAALTICGMCPVRGPCAVRTAAEPKKYLYVGMIRGGRYYPLAKTGRTTEGGT